MKLFSLNPYTILAAAVSAVALLLSIYFYGVHVGNVSSKLDCEKRVAAIMKQIEDHNREIDRINREWQSRIDALAEKYAAQLAEEEKQNEELSNRINDYEAQLGQVNDDCRIDQSDLDRVLGHSR